MISGLIVILLILWAWTIYIHFRNLHTVHTSATFSIGNFTIKTENNIMVIFQNDQEFDVTLTYTDDGGAPVDVETIVSASTNPESIAALEPERLDTGIYKVTVRGIEPNTGSADISVTADARFGEEVRTIEYVLACTTTPNEAEGVSAEISELRNQ